jgi:HD-like signal output (HDOD) protein/ActR/RegA family two-component response regulator
MRRVLFVGKDQPLWQEVRKRSANFAAHWNACFSQSVNEALALVDERQFDAVVADVQLQDTCGVDLLDAVLRRQPGALRVVLSDHTDLQSTILCIGKAHHHLLRPCDADMLLHALNQGITTETWLPGGPVRELMGKMRWVPSPPNIYFQIILEIDSPNASVETIGEIIRQDPPTTAKVLQMANSAVFGLQLQVNEPGEAVAFLGFEATRTLVLMAHTFSEFDRLPRGGFSIDELWYHSVLVGQYARQIALFEEQPADVAELAYSAGLLHDLGKILFAANVPVPFGQAIQLARHEQLSLHDSEFRLLGATHAEIGGCLLAIWGLPPALIEAVALHHQPSVSRDNTFGALAAVHAADVFAQKSAPDRSQPSMPELDNDYLHRIGMGERAESWRRQCEESSSQLV